jgi:hypothetical protein
MVEELPKTPPPVVEDASLLPFLEADITLLLILLDFAVGLFIGWFLLVRIFLN